MAKKLKYNSDFMSLKMDKELEQIEDKLSALYANSAYDLNKKFAEFSKTFEKEDKAMALKVQSGEITNAEYSLWRQRHIVQTDLYKATVDSLTDIMVSTDVMAMALVDEALPSVIAQSYNFTQSLGWASAEASGLNVGNFQIYNADSVQAILRENKKILPVVDVPKDEAWNHDKINKEIASSIIKGDPIPKVAENLQKVAKMDENSAIRNARTAMTSAENLGRTESAERLKQNGIPVEEVWQATYDNRVRDTHLLMDGTKRSENGTFGDDILETPLKYPADPDGDPEEIYNCRCRLGVVLQGIDHSKDAELYEQFMKEKYPESYQKMQENAGYQAKQEQIGQAQERKERLEAELAQKQPAEEKPEIVEEKAEEKPEEVLEANDNAIFIPAETVEEAEQRARELGAEYTKFDGWKLERANNALEALERLPAECRPKAVLDGKNTSLITQRPLGRKSESWYGVTYDYSNFSLATMYIGFDKTDYDGGQVVGLNVQAFKTLSKLSEAKEAYNQKYFEKTGNFWSFNTSGEAVAHHEMGHCFYNALLAPNESLEKEWEGLAKTWADSSNYDMLQSPSEAFAEAWAGYNVGDDRVPDYIVEFIKGVL